MTGFKNMYIVNMLIKRMNNVQQTEILRHSDKPQSKLPSIVMPFTIRQQNSIDHSEDFMSRVKRAKSIIIGQKFKKYKLNFQECLNYSPPKSCKLTLQSASKKEHSNLSQRYYLAVKANNSLARSRNLKFKTQESCEFYTGPIHASKVCKNGKHIKGLNHQAVDIGGYLLARASQKNIKEQQKSILLENIKQELKGSSILPRYLTKKSPEPKNSKQLFSNPQIKSYHQLKNLQRKNQIKRRFLSKNNSNILSTNVDPQKKWQCERWDIVEGVEGDGYEEMLGQVEIPSF